MSLKEFYSSGCEKSSGKNKRCLKTPNYFGEPQLHPLIPHTVMPIKTCTSQGWQHRGRPHVHSKPIPKSHWLPDGLSHPLFISATVLFSICPCPAAAHFRGPHPWKRKALLYVSLGVCVPCMCSFSGIIYKRYKKGWKYGMVLCVTVKPAGA